MSCDEEDTRMSYLLVRRRDCSIFGTLHLRRQEYGVSRHKGDVHAGLRREDKRLPCLHALHLCVRMQNLITFLVGLSVTRRGKRFFYIFSSPKTSSPLQGGLVSLSPEVICFYSAM